MIRKIRFNLWTIIMSAYLINQFYITNFISIQRLVLLSSLALYVLINLSQLKHMLNIGSNKKSKIYIIVLLFVIWFIYVSIIPIISGSGDYSYISYCITFYSWTLYLLAIIVRIKKKCPYEDTFTSFMLLYIKCMELYVISTIIILIMPFLREILFKTIYNNEKQFLLINRDKYYTRIGWAGYSGYSTSIKCTVAISFVIYFIIKSISQNRKIRKGEYFRLALLLIGNMFYARTGMLVSIICIIITLFYIAFILGKFKFFLKYFIMVLIMGGIGIHVLRTYSENSEAINWMLEIFLNYVKGNGIESTSTKIIFNSMLFRIRPTTLLLGDGFYTSPTGGYYMGTDLGFMRLVLYFGIPGMLLIYFVYFFTLKSIKKVVMQRTIGIIQILLFVIFLGFEFKGESIVILVPLAFVLLVASCKTEQLI